MSQIVKSGWGGVEINCIANDSKCTKFRNICFWFGPAPEEKPYYLITLQYIIKVNKVQV